jgi:hypothetical protein
MFVIVVRTSVGEVLWYKAVSLVGSRSGSRAPELDAHNFAKTRMGSKL